MTSDRTPEAQSYAYLVINPGGGSAKGYATEQQARHQAEAMKQIVVKMPVLADYR
jgi:hypothetical protein